MFLHTAPSHRARGRSSFLGPSLAFAVPWFARLAAALACSWLILVRRPDSGAFEQRDVESLGGMGFSGSREPGVRKNRGTANKNQNNIGYAQTREKHNPRIKDNKKTVPELERLAPSDNLAVALASIEPSHKNRLNLNLPG